MKIIEMNIKDLIPYENNPRNNEKSIDLVANSIKEFGFKVPVVIDKNNIVVAGHTRIKASEKLGLEKIPCIIADDLTDEQIKAFRLADNKVSEFSEWDFNKLELELYELEQETMKGFGFKFDEINPDDFGENFELPADDKSELQQITFTLHNAQAELIKGALKLVKECEKTYGNTNRNGNAIFQIVSEWVDMKNGI